MTTLNIPAPTTTRYMYYPVSGIIALHDNNALRIVSGNEMVHQYNLRTCTALIAWRDIDKVYQHSDTMLLYFLLMEILYITGALVQIILINMYLSLQTLEAEICNYINNAWGFALHFVPLPDTLQL